MKCIRRVDGRKPERFKVMPLVRYGAQISDVPAVVYIKMFELGLVNQEALFYNAMAPDHRCFFQTRVCACDIVAVMYFDSTEEKTLKFWKAGYRR